MVANKRQLTKFVSIALPLVLLVSLLGPYEVEKRQDSDSYTNFASAILSGTLFEQQEPEKVTFGRAVRTPGYPLMIAVANVLSPQGSDGIIYMHMALGIFTLVFLCLALQNYCPPIITGLVVLLLDLLMLDYYRSIMTEWVAFNLLLIVFALLVIAFRNPSLRNLFIVGLLAAFAVLVRPAMLPLMLLMPLLVIVRGRPKLLECAFLSTTVLPLILWMSINQHYLGSFALANLSGFNLFGVGAQIGHADEQAGDAEEFRQFIRDINDKKTPKKGAEDESVADFDTTYHMIRLNANIFIIAYPLKPTDMGLVAFHRDYLGEYGWRAIKNSPGNYVRYVLHGMKLFVQFGSPYATLYLLAIPVFCLWRKKVLLLASATFVMFALHFGHALLAASFQAVFERFLALTFYPYLGAVIFCFVGLIFAEELPQRLLARLPASLRNLFEPVLRLE